MVEELPRGHAFCVLLSYQRARWWLPILACDSTRAVPGTLEQDPAKPDPCSQQYRRGTLCLLRSARADFFAQADPATPMVNGKIVAARMGDNARILIQDGAGVRHALFNDYTLSDLICFSIPPLPWPLRALQTRFWPSSPTEPSPHLEPFAPSMRADSLWNRTWRRRRCLPQVARPRRRTTTGKESWQLLLVAVCSIRRREILHQGLITTSEIVLDGH